MQKTTVKYVKEYAEFQITVAEYELICKLYTLNLHVPAIKFLRHQYGIGLKEAKDICDSINDQAILKKAEVASPINSIDDYYNIR